MNINKVLLYGNLTRDPELRALPSGQQVANFSIATNRTYTDKEGRKQDMTEYHNIVAFGRQAEVIGQYMKKGRPLYIEGRLQTRSWEAEGKKNYRTEIVIDSFQFGASAGGEGGARSGAPREATEDPGQSGSGFGGSSMPSISASSGAMDSGSEIQYPDDEINPEDIPF